MTLQALWILHTARPSHEVSFWDLTSVRLLNPAPSLCFRCIFQLFGIKSPRPKKEEKSSWLWAAGSREGKAEGVWPDPGKTSRKQLEASPAVGQELKGALSPEQLPRWEWGVVTWALGSAPGLWRQPPVSTNMLIKKASNLKKSRKEILFVFCFVSNVATLRRGITMEVHILHTPSWSSESRPRFRFKQGQEVWVSKGPRQGVVPPNTDSPLLLLS